MITEQIGVDCVLINSACFTAQIRNRLYWCNFPISVPTKYSNATLADVLVDNSTRPPLLTLKNTNLTDYTENITVPFAFTYYRPSDAPDTKFHSAKVKPRTDHKANPICAVINELQSIFDGTIVRKLECVEAERLQGLPDGWTTSLTRVRAYRCIGNAFTVPVIQHILRSMVSHMETEVS